MPPLLGLLLCFCPLLATCHGTACKSLATLHSEFYNWQIAEESSVNPQNYSGILAKMDERKAKVDEFYKRLKTIPMRELTKKDIINYKILHDMLTTYIDGYQWRFFQNLGPVTFLEGPQTRLRGFYFNTHHEFYNYVAELWMISNECGQYEILMKEGIRLNRTYSIHSMIRLQEQFHTLLDPANVLQFYRYFNYTLDSFTMDDIEREKLRSKGLATVKGVFAALERLWEFIRDEYIPNTRPEIGISSLDGGMEYYEACIRWYLSENRTAKEVHDIGQKEVDRIVANMYEVMARQGFTGSVRQYFQTLKTRNFFFETAEELTMNLRHQIFDIIDPKLDKYFNNNPNLPLVLRQTDNDDVLGFYTQGSADGTRPGIFWVNTHRPKDFGNFTMAALSIHETNPGHHLQFSIAMLSDTPDFRRMKISYPLYQVPFAFPRYSAFVEGWGLYAEYLGEEMGLYRDDYELMGRYSLEILRAGRLVVDTGIHAFNWTREKSINYLLNYTDRSYDSIADQVDRYITWPGQALSYKIGEMKIKELRTKAEQTLGDKFDIGEFHSVVLESGTVSLSVLEDLVNDWLNPTPITATCGTDRMLATFMWPSVVSFVLVMAFY